MVGADLRSIFSGLLELTLLAGGLLYAGLVLANYRDQDARTRPQIDLHDPAHSAERWAVWLGIQALSLLVRVGTPILGMLSEASADVGDWFLSHRHHETH